MRLSANEIEEAATLLKMIEPFVDYKVSEDEHGKKILSYGLSGAGYDIRLEKVFNVDRKSFAGAIDPKNPDAYELSERPLDFFLDFDSAWILAPFETVLGVSKEYFNIPTDIMGTCMGKSSYARIHVVTHVTPLEPGWSGYLTLEIANLSQHPVLLYKDEGICQIVFDEISNHTQYQGHYQNQDEQRPYRALETPEIKRVQEPYGSFDVELNDIYTPYSIFLDD